MGDLLARLAADPAVSTILTAFVAAAIALWLLAAMWVHGDAERRTESELIGLAAAAWILLSTPLLLPLSLLAYVLVRPGEAASERRVRELTAAFVVDSLVTAACPRCGEVIDGAWRRCPTCATWLATPCADCGRWSDAELAACPWCGGADRARPAVETPLVDPGPFVSEPGRRVAALTPGATPSLASIQVAGGVPALNLAASRAQAERSSPTVERRPWPSRTRQRRVPGGSRSRSLDRSAAGGGHGARPRP
jgi:hypothetical protein